MYPLADHHILCPPFASPDGLLESIKRASIVSPTHTPIKCSEWWSSDGVFMCILVTLWPFYSFCIITLCDYFSIVSFLQFPIRFLWTLFCTYMSPSAAMLHIRTWIEHAHITKGLPDDNNEESQSQALSWKPYTFPHYYYYYHNTWATMPMNANSMLCPTYPTSLLWMSACLPSPV